MDKLKIVMGKLIAASQRAAEPITVGHLFPELTSENECSVCHAKLADHPRLAYFVDPSHINLVRKYKEQVFALLSETEPSQYALATAASPSVPTVKEMIHILDRYVGAKLSPNTPAYVYMWLSLFAWMVPSEMFKEQFQNVTRALERAVNYYNIKSGRLLFELRHRHAGDVKSFTVGHEQEGGILFLMAKESFQEVENQLLGIRLAAKKIAAAPRPLSTRVLESLARKGQGREEPARFRVVQVKRSSQEAGSKE